MSARDRELINYHHSANVIIILFCLLILGGCATKSPSIAHTHVGHAMTGWHDTPNKQGLFVIAESLARDANQHAIHIFDNGNDVGKSKHYVELVIQATDQPDTKAMHNHISSSSVKSIRHYGVKQALQGAVDHIEFAATSKDASENIKLFATTFSNNANTVIDRCDLISVLGKDIIKSNSDDEIQLLSEEIVKLTKTNLQGADLDADGLVGNQPDEYGMVQLRTQIEAMINREDPPYTTVDTWYLFNLIRLPSGEWMFKDRSSTSSGNNYGYGAY